jgi:hypothetical protein
MLTTFTDCTAKAVENRLYTWKKKNVGSGGDGTPKAASVPKTPKSRPKKQKLVTPESDFPDGFLGEFEGLGGESPLASKKRKRVTPKKTVDYKETSDEDESVEEEYIPLGSRKHVKMEPVEEMPVFGENVPLEQGEEVV